MYTEQILREKMLEDFLVNNKRASVPVRHNMHLNRKNAFAEGKIGAKVAVALSQEKQLLC